MIISHVPYLLNTVTFVNTSMVKGLWYKQYALRLRKGFVYWPQNMLKKMFPYKEMECTYWLAISSANFHVHELYRHAHLSCRVEISLVTVKHFLRLTVTQQSDNRQIDVFLPSQSAREHRFCLHGQRSLAAGHITHLAVFRSGLMCLIIRYKRLLVTLVTELRGGLVLCFFDSVQPCCFFSSPPLQDDKYWQRRKKNNMAAKRSRDARRLKENQITVRAAFLERENAALRSEVAELRKECGRFKNVAGRYEAKFGPL